MRKILVLLFLIPSLAFAGWPIGGSPNSGGGGGEHNALEGLQGGAADEYYHLDFTDYSVVSDMAAAGVAPDANRFYLSTAAATWTLGTFSAFGLTFIALADAAAARTNLGLGALATGDNAGDVSYTCAVDANWSGGLCPGNSGASFDDLSSRVKTLESAGTPSVGAWDWTQAVGSPNVADWTDANSAGADVSLSTLADCGTGDCVKMVAGASTTDNYGATTPIGAGDFTWCAKFSRNTLNVTSQGTAVTGAVFAAFVDGTDLDNDIWYGLGSVAISDDFDASLVIQARGNSAGNHWDAAYMTVVSNPYRSFMINACFVRSGTDLTVYFSPHSDGGWVKSVTETVSAGAGLMAIKIDVGDANEYRALVYAYGDPGGLPWQ